MLINFENVKKSYGSFCLDCSFSIEKGRVTGIIGANGAGKTTAFKAALGLVKPDSGKITVFGKDVSELSVQDRGNLGVVLSDSFFSGYLTIKKLVPIMKAMYMQFDSEEFLKNCRRFNLDERKKLKEFSTGMKAKLKLLCAVSHGAELLILDEPTAGLDVVARDELIDMLREYMENSDCSVLISSHISGDLENFCDDIYLIDNGKIVLHEDTDVITGEYGVLKLSDEQYRKADKKYFIRVKQEPFGYMCLTNKRQYYTENMPSAVIEKCGIDDIVRLTANGRESID